LSLAEQRAAALLVLGLPGMRFLHQGQFTGARRRVPVQLGRCIREPTQAEIEKMYSQILTTLPSSAAGKGPGELLRPRAAWAENPTAQNFIVVQWQTDPQEFDLVVVNLAPHRSQSYVWLRIGDLAAH